MCALCAASLLAAHSAAFGRSLTHLPDRVLFTNSPIMLNRSTDLAEFDGLARLPQVVVLLHSQPVLGAGVRKLWPAESRFPCRSASFGEAKRFSRTNCFAHAHCQCVRIGSSQESYHSSRVRWLDINWFS